MDVSWKVIYVKLIIEFECWNLCKSNEMMINLMYNFHCKLIYR